MHGYAEPTVLSRGFIEMDKVNKREDGRVAGINPSLRPKGPNPKNDQQQNVPLTLIKNAPHTTLHLPLLHWLSRIIPTQLQIKNNNKRIVHKQQFDIFHVAVQKVLLYRGQEH